MFNHKGMLITNQKELESFCLSLQSADFITVDTEFLREKTYYPKLCLLQLGAPDGRAAAIDPLVEGIDLKPIFELLADERVLKVFHAARQDLEIFYNLTECVPSPIFDTQIAAMVCGYGDSVGYESLVKQITGHQLDKSVQFTNWSHRPLSKKQVEYAIGDVTYLVELYQHLAKELQKNGRTEWVFQEEEILNNPATYKSDPYDAWKRIKMKGAKPKSLAVLRELAAWREERAREKNLPKPWVMRDETLADLAAQAPDKAEQLKKIRNIPAEMANGALGSTILALIKKAVESDRKSWPEVDKRKAPSADVSAKAEILSMLLKIKAAEYGVAARLIADKDDLQDLAEDEKADIPAVKGWRHEIFGEDARKVLRGELAIGLKNNKISKFPVGKNTD